MLSNTFNYVAGAASIISLIIALTPYFPEYKGYIRYAAVFFIGTLAGSLFASASSQAIVFQFEGSVTQMMLLISAMISLAIVIVVILGVVLGGEVKESHKLAGGSAAALFFAMMVLYAATNFDTFVKSSRPRDISESLALARYYKQSGKMSRAMPFYCEALQAAMYLPNQMEIEQEANAICSSPPHQ
jgi:hypothetical protein